MSDVAERMKKYWEGGTPTASPNIRHPGPGGSRGPYGGARTNRGGRVDRGW